MSDGSSSKPNRLPLVVLLVLLCLLGGYFVLRARTSQPVRIGQAHSSPTSAIWREGNWYWLEGAGKPGARLIRANASVTMPIVSADGINTYAVAAGKAVWSVRDGKQWNVTIAAADGSHPVTLCGREREPHGLYLTGDRVFWLEEVPPAIPDSGPLPPLGPSLQLISLPIAGGQPAVLSTLLEPLAGQVLGVRDGQVIVSAVRHDAPGATTFYRVPLNGGSPHRLAGEMGIHVGLLTREGVLYWSAPSRESTQNDRVLCVRRLGKDEKPETLTDWLPASGQLYETDHGIYYVDGETLPAVWSIASQKELPHALSLPQNFGAVAAGDKDLLVKRMDVATGDIPVFQMGLP